MVAGSSSGVKAGELGRFRLLRLTVVAAVVYIVVVAFTVVTAVQPSVIGTWFTLYEEHNGHRLVYKVEVKIAEVVPKTVKVAFVDLDIRVTNNHEFGVRVADAFYRISDFHRERTSLIVQFSDVTIDARSVEEFSVKNVKVTKVLGFGPRYAVQGYLVWYEVYHPSDLVGPFRMDFNELHSINEFIH